MAFGSFDSKAGSHTVNEINMVPLIDVMLVLLVIFIITAPLLSHSIKINIPQATAQPVEQDPKSIDLAVDGNGTLFWNESPVGAEELKQRFAIEAKQDPQPEIRIRADLNTRYEILAQIMSDAKAAGMKKLGFITRPGSSGATPAGHQGSDAAPAAAASGAGTSPAAAAQTPAAGQ